MSSAVRSYISDIFGVEDCSDCVIVFSCSNPSYQRPSQPSSPAANARDEVVTLGEPLPAHTVVICGGSQRFRAQVERWTRQQDHRVHSADSKPTLRVPLNREEELPDALAALRFMYNGKLDVSGAAAVLRVRRQAAYLQVEGCVEACDTALLALVKDTSDNSAMGPLAGVSELHATATALGLLPNPADEPAVMRALMDACRQQLVEYSTSVIFEGESIASVGELLGWAFGDAPSALSNRAVRQQMEALSVVAMEALLGCETFATDDEASVLLMLATWMECNANTSHATRHRLSRLVRLSQLSDTYLYAILPAILRWFPIGPDELAYLYEHQRAPETKRAGMAAVAAGKYDCSSAWYSETARPPLPYMSARSYEWSVSQLTLRARLAEDPTGATLQVTFRDGFPHVVALGFEWSVSLGLVQQGREVAVRLNCGLPPALRVNLPANGKLPTVVTPGSVRLAVYGWRRDGTRQEVWSCSCQDVYVPVGSGWDGDTTLPLGLAAAGGAGEATAAGRSASGADGAAPGDALAAWSAYLHDGRLTGVLEWTAAG